MEELKARVQAMLEGEKKRREVAEKFLLELEEILLPVMPVLFGAGECDMESVYVGGGDHDSSLYFRYVGRYSDYLRTGEGCGFYLSPSYHLIWGKSLEELRGSDFWSAIEAVMRWTDVLVGQMDIRSVAREKIISLISPK